MYTSVGCGWHNV